MCVRVCVCRHAGDNVSVCVLLILSIVSSLIISPPPRHGHQLLRGAIIWNWFSRPPLRHTHTHAHTQSLAQNIKCSFGKTEEWKLMIKGCQHLKLQISANSCERCLLPSLSLTVYFCSLFLSTEKLGVKTVGKRFLLCAFTCLWVGWGEEEEEEGREERGRQPDGRNLSPPTQKKQNKNQTNPLC